MIPLRREGSTGSQRNTTVPLVASCREGFRGGPLGANGEKGQSTQYGVPIYNSKEY